MLNDLKRIKVTFPTEIVKEIDNQVVKNSYKNRSAFFQVILEARLRKRTK